MKTVGTILVLVGTTGMIIGLVISGVTFVNMPNLDTPEDWGVIAAGLVTALVSGLIAIIGAIPYFIGRRQAKKQKNQTSPEILKDR